MKHMGAVSLLAVILVLPACAASAPAKVEDGSDLMQVSRDWAAAAASGDVERVLAYWADDAVVLAPDRPAIVGKEAIRRFLQESMAIPGFSITWQPERAAVSAGGDLGYMVERNRVTFADSTGALSTHYGKAVTIWKKNAAGEWKCVVDTWNANPTEHVLAPGA